MFWRLFLTFVMMVMIAVGLVGVIIVRRNEGEQLFLDLAYEVGTTIAIITVLSVVPAYLLARNFTRPLNELSDGARRIADGDWGHKIRVARSREFGQLAHAFNGMSERLAGTFALLDYDREQLRTILSGMVEGVVAFDTSQRILFANDRAGVLLDFDPVQSVGRKLWEVSRQPSLQTVVEKALAGEGPQRQELDWKSSEAKTIAVYVSRLPGTDSLGAVMVLHDISELRRLERLRQDFVANVSHELKTPLAVIKSNIESLQDGAADDPEARGPFLERVSQEADRLDALIQDLLRLARIESGDQPLQFQPVRLDEAIAECLDRLAIRAEDKSMQLIEVPPATPVAVWADETCLHQILDNLVDNAIKYTHSGGRIIIRWTATPTHAQIEIQDNGLGIAPRDLERIFERFYRADKARSRAEGGTGLGLAIVKHLVSSMNGQIGVTSEVGQGSSFRVSLPRAGD